MEDGRSGRLGTLASLPNAELSVVEGPSWFVLQATVLDTMERRTWLLGFGHTAGVWEPATHRAQFRAEPEGFNSLHWPRGRKGRD
jgi:hypothetical protein